MFLMSSNSRSAFPHSLGISKSLDISASASIVWALLVDVDSYPNHLSTCMSVRVYQPHPTNRRNPRGSSNASQNVGSVKAGSKWVEVRQFKGRTYKMLVSTTAVDNEEDDPKSFTVATDALGSTSTATHTLTTIDERSCRLSLSYGIVPHRWWSQIYFACFKRILRKDCLEALEHDLADIAKAAVAVATGRDEAR